MGILSREVLTAILLVLYSQAAQGEAKQSTTFSYRAAGPVGLILLDAVINNDQTATLLLDTGVGRSTLTESLARRAGLKSSGPSKLDSTPHPIRIANVAILTIGGLTLRDARFVVVPDDRLDLLRERGRVDGILGMDVLQRFAVLLDFPMKRITIWHPGSLTADERRRAGMADAFEAPLRVSDNRALVESRANSTESEWLLVDTGAEATSISSGLVERLKLASVERDLPRSGLGGAFRVDVVRIPSLAIGSLELSDVPVEVPREEGPGLPNRLLGLDIFRRYRVLLDVPAKKLYLKLPQ